MPFKDVMVVVCVDCNCAQADIGRHVVADRQWEIYRFLLVDRPELSLTSSRIRSLLTERVQYILMG